MASIQSRNLSAAAPRGRTRGWISHRYSPAVPLSRLATNIGEIFRLAVASLALILAGVVQPAPAAVAATDFGPAVVLEDVEIGSLLLKTDGSDVLHAAPTVDTDVVMRITGMVARVTVEQRFSNPSTQWMNGVYVFPLPATAAVDHMRFKIGERIIEGQIKERQQARKIYAQAKSAGKKASLVEQQRPNIFTNSVANIGPGESIVVTIEYQQTLNYDKGRFSVRFPMTIGIRYIPGSRRVAGFDGGGWAFNTDQVPDASTITPPVTEAGHDHDNPVSISVELNTGFPLAQVLSPYHKIRTQHVGQHRYRIEFADGVVSANRDFELFWIPEPQYAPRAALFTQEKDQELYGLLMMIPPESEWAEQTALPREVIYVIDTSGSMSGTSIAQAKEALLFGLERLQSDDAFNVVQFNSSTHKFAPAAVPATATNLAGAKAYVLALRANGGTEMAGALGAVLHGTDDASRVRQVVFLTDGSVGNEKRLFTIIHNQLGDSRLFTVGIGSAPNSYFMREAATIGRGTYTYIGSVQEVRAKMRDLFEKMQYPVLSNITLEWPNGSTMDSWPDPVRDLYIHEPLVVSFKLAERESALRVLGRMNGAARSTELPVDASGGAEGLDVLWARNKIRSLEQQTSRGAPRDEIKAAITDLGLEHHIVTAYTSLVAVDVTPTRHADALARNAAVPAKKPHGWEMQIPQARLPQTATPAALHMLVGLMLALASMLARTFRRPAAAQRGTKSC